MIRIAHFLRDDNKFIPDSIWCFDNSGIANNKYYCVSKSRKGLYRLHNEKVLCVSESDAKKLILEKGLFDVICLHSLYALPLPIIPQINKDVKLVWFSWGYDIYMNPEPFTPLLDNVDIYKPETTRLLSEIPRERVSIKSFIRNGINKFSYLKYQKSLLYDCIERVDFFAGVFPIEYDMLKQRYSNFHAQKISHNYIHPDEFQNKDIDTPTSITGCNIQLGHSACLEDNHIDVMKDIVDCVDNTANIFCPLSYGGSKYYINEVINKGKYYFGNRFKALTDFLPLEEYTRIQNSCNKFVLGSIRQQATCNCLTAMWNGLQLYLYKDSINSKQYTEFGLKFSNIDEGINEIEPNINIAHNRKIIESIYSYRAWVNDLKEFINKL